MKAHLTELLTTAAKSLVANTQTENVIEGTALDALLSNITLERPKSAEHGDFATNLALVLAKPLRQNPRAIATQLVDELPQSAFIEKTEIAGAGFISR